MLLELSSSCSLCVVTVTWACAVTWHFPWNHIAMCIDMRASPQTSTALLQDLFDDREKAKGATFFEATEGETVRPMLDVSWAPMLGAFSVLFEEYSEGNFLLSKALFLHLELYTEIMNGLHTFHGAGIAARCRLMPGVHATQHRHESWYTD